jgi:hypothetical protein
MNLSADDDEGRSSVAIVTERVGSLHHRQRSGQNSAKASKFTSVFQMGLIHRWDTDDVGLLLTATADRRLLTRPR